MTQLYLFWCRSPKPYALNTLFAIHRLEIAALTEQFIAFAGPADVRDVHFLHNGRPVDNDWLSRNYAQTAPEARLKVLHVFLGTLTTREVSRLVQRDWITQYFHQAAAVSLDLGMFIDKRVRHGLDFVKINLCHFEPHLRTVEHVFLTAMQWKILTDGDDEKWTWRYDTQEKSGRTKRMYPVLTDHTVLDIDTSEEPTVNLLTAECQSGKSLDLNVLSWVLPRLGYLVLFLARNKNGESTIADAQKMAKKMARVGEHIQELRGDRVISETKSFLTTTFLRTVTPTTPPVGRWTTGTVIAGLQNHTFMLHVGFTLAACGAVNGNVHTALLADEDDDIVGSYDGRGSQVERYSKVETLVATMRCRLNKEQSKRSSRYLTLLNQSVTDLRAQLSDGADAGEVLNREESLSYLVAAGLNASLREFVHLDIRVTSTGFASIHNSRENDSRLNVLIKPVPTDYKGHGVGCRPVEWRETPAPSTFVASKEKRIIGDLVKPLEDCYRPTVDKAIRSYVQGRSPLDEFILKLRGAGLHVFTAGSRALSIDDTVSVCKKLRLARTTAKDPFHVNLQAIRVTMLQAIKDYNDNHPHVNVLLSGVGMTQMQCMDDICKRVVSRFGNSDRAPMIGFTYNSDRACNIYVNCGKNSAFVDRDRLNSVRDDMERAFTKYISRGSTQTEAVRTTYCWKVKLHNRKVRSTHIYYEFAKCISRLFSIEKPFFVCVSGALAGRQAVFKDKDHSYFLTHMYASLPNDLTAVIQKVGRICGRDSDSVTPRKLFCDKKSHLLIQKALTLNRNYMTFLARHRGLSVTQALQLADGSVIDDFKEMEEGGMFHRPTYSKAMNREVPKLLPEAYREAVAAHEQSTLGWDLPPPVVERQRQHTSIPLVDPSTIPRPEYQRRFELDLRNAADLSEGMADWKEKEACWRRMELFADGSPRGDNGKTWTTICAMFISNGGRVKLSGAPFPDVAVRAMGLELNEGSFKRHTTVYTASMEKGNSWRARVATGRHLVCDGDTGLFYLAWRAPQ